MACPVAWRRVVRPASSSSHRPASSSPRNRRVAVSSPQTAPRMISRPRHSQATSPPAVSSRRAGPNIAAKAALWPKACADFSREAAVGNLEW